MTTNTRTIRNELCQRFGLRPEQVGVTRDQNWIYVRLDNDVFNDIGPRAYGHMNRNAGRYGYAHYTDKLWGFSVTNRDGQPVPPELDITLDWRAYGF